MELKKGFSIKEMKRVFNEIVFWLPEENMAGYKKMFKSRGRVIFFARIFDCL